MAYGEIIQSIDKLALVHSAAIHTMHINVPFVKRPSTGKAQQRDFLVFKVVTWAVVVISEVLR